MIVFFSILRSLKASLLVALHLKSRTAPWSEGADNDDADDGKRDFLVFAVMSQILKMMMTNGSLRRAGFKSCFI